MEYDIDFVKMHLIRMSIFCIWFYLCVYLVSYFSLHKFMNNPMRPLINAVSLLLGPLSFFCAYVVQVARVATKKKMTLSEVLAKVFSGTFWGGAIGMEIPSNSISVADITLLDNSGKSAEDVYGGKGAKADTAIVDLAKEIIANAIQSVASDILIDPLNAEIFTVRFRVDGKLRLSRELDRDLASSVINCIKAVSGMDISEKRKPLDGAFTAKVKNETASFRVATAGVVNGQKMSIRLLSLFGGRLELDELGFKDKDYDDVSAALLRTSGMILICGPTGSGKSTTMYGMLSSIDTVERNIITIEDPVEHTLEGVSQIEINTKAGVTFGDTLKGILRQDPDVIGVGEIRDQLTAQTAVQASHTGHLVIASLHSSDNLTALLRLTELGVQPGLLASGLDVIISQRLVRKLCDKCKRHANLSDAQKAALKAKGIETEGIMEAVGCSKCGGTGYKGRIAIFDVLRLSDALKNNIADMATISRETLVSTAGRELKSKLKKEAMKKVITGQTCFKEVKQYL